MPYAPVPIQQTWPSLVARKRAAADKREAEAARMRAEADDLERRWLAFRAKRAAAKASPEAMAS